MTLTTVDSIVRRALMEMGRTIHWYVFALGYALDEIKGLSTSGQMPALKSVVLQVGQFNEVDLPDDYVTYVKVGILNGIYVLPGIENPAIAIHPNINQSGQQIPFPSPATSSTDYPNSTFIEDYEGAYAGGVFNASDGTRRFEFREAIDRGQIQFSTFVAEGTSVVLEYIGYDTGNASSLVHPAFERPIIDYIKWNMNSKSLTESRLLRDEYYLSRRKSYRVMSGLTKELLVEFARKFRSPTIVR